MIEHPDIQLVRSLFDAFGTGDLDALGGLLAPDVVRTVPGSHRLSGEHRGRDAVIANLAVAGRLTRGSLRVELRWVFTTGHGQVVSVNRCTATRGATSIDEHVAVLFTISGGLIIGIVEFFERQEPFDALWGGRGAA
ncbi:hypothetical protein GCM10010245_89770 [Streptomyces spectabilis]|uniref:SnoaL-like domain-containing protein n=1 Tax=Streptomyces spectabilis TaxID=68270 RepID=A0A7W8EZW6_STRST|nr:nuclear transport factor 2 family protein [Streptomyces spectabilis]MBB5109828.1 hypothetical protein [Streptomyces spectabilis]GGV56762.1 hypothetical protein GCM10010245_89770 [Streptomyces spectabilis]